MPAGENHERGTVTTHCCCIEWIFGCLPSVAKSDTGSSAKATSVIYADWAHAEQYCWDAGLPITARGRADRGPERCAMGQPVATAQRNRTVKLAGLCGPRGPQHSMPTAGRRSWLNPAVGLWTMDSASVREERGGRGGQTIRKEMIWLGRRAAAPPAGDLGHSCRRLGAASKQKDSTDPSRDASETYCTRTRRPRARDAPLWAKGHGPSVVRARADQGAWRLGPPFVLADAIPCEAVQCAVGTQGGWADE